MNKLTRFLKDLYEHERFDVCLPLFHLCTFEQASKYAFTRRVATTPCPRFNKNTIYLFLGRSAFRKVNQNGTIISTPICFILKPNNNIDIDNVFPFDTGAVLLDLYQPVLKKEDMDKVKVDFTIGNDLTLAYRLLKFFFGSIKDYVSLNAVTLSEKQLKDIVRVESVTELEYIHGIYTCKWADADIRKITVEVHSDSDLLLTRKNLAGMIIPTDFDVNKEFQELCDDTAAEMVFYDEPNAHLKDNYYSMITERSIEISKKTCHAN